MADYGDRPSIPRLLRPTDENMAGVYQLGMEMTPGLGDAMSARDAYQAGRGALSSFQQGNYGQGALQAGEAALGALGTLPFIPNLAGVIKAYHGSPHRFDKFSMDKIGTGEGAQAYGHGLYFAESPDVAHGYRMRTAGQHADLEFDGVPLKESRDYWGMQDKLNAEGKWRLNDAFKKVDSWIRQGYSKDEAIKHLKMEERNYPEMLDALDELDSRLSANTGQGSFYEVTLQPDHEDLLDWDAPLSEQSPKVREAVEEVRSIYNEMNGHNALDGDIRGGQLYMLLNGPFGPDSPEKVSKDLLAAGIPGIRYLDAGSRSAKDGTRNIVLFDDNLVSIDRVE